MPGRSLLLASERAPYIPWPPELIVNHLAPGGFKVCVNSGFRAVEGAVATQRAIAKQKGQLLGFFNELIAQASNGNKMPRKLGILFEFLA